MSEYYFPPLDSHVLRSEIVGQDYRIDVMQPHGPVGSSIRSPVLYLTDGNLSFDFAMGTARILQTAGQTVPFTIVSIGYPSSSPLAGSVLRWRDFTSADRPAIPSYPPPPFADIPRPLPDEPCWGGADEFLAFMADELCPFVETNYPVMPGDRAIAGHSLGAGFGLYALTEGPDVFGRFLLVSPSVSFDGDDYGLRRVRDCLAEQPASSARMFLAVGSLEDEDPSPAVRRAQFLTSFRKLVPVLEGAGIDLAHSEFQGETHASVWPAAFGRGLRWLFDPQLRKARQA